MKKCEEGIILLIEAEKHEIHLSLDELISFSYPSGSLSRTPDYYEKPKTAISIADSFAEQNEQYSRGQVFSASVIHDGYTYLISSAADLCSVGINSLEIINVKASGGKKNASVPTIDTWKREVACITAIASNALGVRECAAKLIYSFDRRMQPDEYICASSVREATDIFFDTLVKASKLIEIYIKRKTERIPAAKDAPFPFEEKRAGQSDFMIASLKALKNGGKLLCEAPTGIGKTMSALFPAVKAFGHGFVDKIFYLTPKTTAQYAAENAVKSIFPDGEGIRSIILSAKDKMCLLREMCFESAETDTPERENRSSREHSKCERCAGSEDYYSRRCDALYELLSASTYLSPDTVYKVAEHHSVCPYELSLDASEYCDLIICDYNYLYDARVYLRRYFDPFLSGEDKRYLPKYAFLADEVHNLPDRARNMYSHSIRTQTLRRISATLGMTELEQKLNENVLAMLSVLEKYDKLCMADASKNERGDICGFAVCDDTDAKLLDLCSEFCEKYDTLKRSETVKIPAHITELYFSMRDLQKKSVYFTDGFKVLCEKTGDNLTYRINCLDPSSILEERTDWAKAAVMFSATLHPSEYYMQSLGMNKNSSFLAVPSPYDKDNFSLTVFDRLSTRFNDRAQTLYALSDIIFTATRAKVGNYMVFFPSYKYMQELHGFFSAMHPNINTVVQRKGMSEAEKADFVARFDENNRETLIGFCVLGGVYAEGIDLVGERLIGSIIVGVGMPRLSNDRNVLAEYYTQKDLEGMMYAYVYPGMTRVMQAVGRVIRSESDRGIAILIDDRFATPVYRSLFPEHWRHAKFVSKPKSLNILLDSFWNR